MRRIEQLNAACRKNTAQERIFTVRMLRVQNHPQQDPAVIFPLLGGGDRSSEFTACG